MIPGYRDVEYLPGPATPKAVVVRRETRAMMGSTVARFYEKEELGSVE